MLVSVSNSMAVYFDLAILKSKTLVFQTFTSMWLKRGRFDFFNVTEDREKSWSGVIAFYREFHLEYIIRFASGSPSSSIINIYLIQQNAC